MRLDVKKTRNLTENGLRYGAEITLIDTETKVRRGDEVRMISSAMVSASQANFESEEARDAWLSSKVDQFQEMMDAAESSEQLRENGAEVTSEEL